MKFSHLKLEQIRHNPAAVKEVLSGQDGRFSMNRVWYYTVRRFHQSNEDKAEAFNYFENSITDHFIASKANGIKKEQLLVKLNNYFDNYKKLGFEFYDYSNRISIDINHGNIVSGEIFRFDKLPENKYAITILDRDDSIWVKELRYPLFQIYFSNVFNCPTENIKVGVYNFQKENHEYESFDEITLKQTEEEVKQISNELNKVRL